MMVQGADASCATSSFGSISLSLVSLRDADVKPLCPSAKNACNNMGCTTPGTYTPAVERYEFKGFVNIGPTSGIPASCCNVRVSWSLCCRNSNISTGAADANFYADAVINRCLSTSPCNSSPVFGNDPYITICGGENVVYNNGAFDPDGDSLSFAFTPALQGFGDPVPYIPPFAFDKPMPWTGSATGLFPQGISCDPINGDIMFTPPNSTSSLFVGVLAVEVKQWKKISGIPTVVGLTRRDIQMVVRPDCLPNNPPRITTIPPNSGNVTIPRTKWDVCVGEQLCFTIIAKDTDFNLPFISDTTYLSWDSTLAQFGATFLPNYNPANRKDTLIGGPREDSYQFCWTPALGMERDNPYLFSIGAMDNKCPNPGRLRRGFSVNVIQRANASITKTTKNCGKWQIGYTKNIPSQVFVSTAIQVAKEPNDYSFSGGSTVYNDTMISPIIQFKKGGKYLVKLTVQMGNCPSTFIDTLYVDTPLTVNAIDTAACFGAATALSATVTNGVTPYTYRWYHSLADTTSPALNAPNFSQPNFTITASTSKYYFIVARDLTGCSTYDSAFVSVKNDIQQTVVTHIKCNGENTGSIIVTPLGPIANYQYKLDSGIFQPSNSFNNLTAGTYTVTIKDSNNCNSIQTVILNQPAALKDTLTTVAPQTCIGSISGSILTLAKGGVEPYKYSKDSIVFDTIHSFTNLALGTYKIHITDSNNCYVSFTKTILPADSIKYTTTAKNLLCSGNTNGEIKISATGGKKPFTYKLGTGAFVSDSMFKNLAANTYNFTIKDANACVLSFIDSVTSPAVIQQNTVGSNLNCFGGNTGSISITATGGTPPYLFKQVSGSLYDTISVFNNLTAGTYALSVKDQNNCLLNFSKTLQQPTVIIASITANPTTCFENMDGQLTITASGGMPPYMFSLDSSSFVSSTTWTNLAGIQHQLVVRDSALCENTFTKTILKAPKVQVGVAQKNSSCFNKNDGSITVTPLVGKSPFIYKINGGAFSSASVFTNLAANNYEVIIKDSLGCVDTTNVTITEPAQIVAGSVIGPATSILHSTETYYTTPQPGLNFRWASVKGIILSSDTTPTISIKWDTVGIGRVGYAVYSDTTCGDTTSMFVTIGSVGLNELSKSWGLNVYPNPTKNSLNIQLQKLPNATQIEMYDVQGKLVLQQELKHSQQFDLEKLAQGIYVLKIGEWTGQVVKE
jgi:large repetitive protein